MRDSLVFRIMLLSAIWIATALVVTAWILTTIYRDHSESYYDNHVQIHLQELVAALESRPSGQVELNSRPADPNYHKAWSGWYWEVRQGNRMLAASPSLGNSRLDIQDHEVSMQTSVFNVPGPNLQPLRIHAIETSLPGFELPVTILASAPAVHVAEDVRDYGWHIFLSFLALGAGLALAVIFQVRMALRPLKDVEHAIARVREGEREQLEGRFPMELQRLVDALNSLLQHNAFLLRRARQQVGDLAHALKSPLTVIKNETRSIPEPQAGLIKREVQDIAGNIEHYLTRARSSGYNRLLGERTRISTVVDDLEFAMQRIYRDKALQLQSDCGQGCMFGGEQEDLEEMIGNLLDNACKWADKNVWISCRQIDRELHIRIEDDGPGIPGPQRERAMQRGVRLESSSPGYGLGLAIVCEMAELYGESLELCDSEHGGLCATLTLPAASSPVQGNPGDT